MSKDLFSIKEHILPAQHVREYPKATKSESTQLQICIKEYRPLSNTDPPPTAVTVIAAHATGVPKECYEPLWDDLYRNLKDKSMLRAIWIADCANHGASSVLNEAMLGDDPHWFDHSRDLLHMVNVFRDEIPRPIMAIGHSMGAAMLLQLSLLHPRLLHSVAAIEPIIQDEVPPGPNNALPSSTRRDLWTSREEAEESIRKNRFYGSWDERALELYCEHGLRPTPTVLYPEQSTADGVTLTTTKAQEAWSFLRSNFHPIEDNDHGDAERLWSPDLSEKHKKYTFHRSEMPLLNHNLPIVRPHVLWIFGEKSHINSPEQREDKLRRTGTGIGGSGGVAANKVEAVVMAKARHMLPLDRVGECASHLADWLEKQSRDFQETEEWHRTDNSGKSEGDMTVLSKLWLESVRRKETTPRPKKGKL